MEAPNHNLMQHGRSAAPAGNRLLELRWLVPLLVAVLAWAACGDETGDPTELTLLTHDSFAISDEVMQEFTRQTGVTVTLLEGGDAGALVNQVVLTRDNPTADVLYGIDNTFISRALEAEVFVPYVSPGLASVPENLRHGNVVTPIDFGDVCLNYDKSYFTGSLPPPTSLDDLIDPAYANLLVVESPATSSPGLAFLYSTIDRYGEDGWQEWWTSLIANGTEIATSWDTAYFGSFTVGGGGDRPIVVSYASSPPAGVIFSEEPLDDAPTAVVTDGCFRQIEYAGILRDSEPARQLIDFMLSIRFQEDIPLNMFVFPANEDALLPSEFVQYAEVPDAPATLDPATIDGNRERWIEQWLELATP